MTPEEYPQLKRGYARIDLDALEANISAIRAHLPGYTQIMPVIKTDGYGHGALPIARMYDKDAGVWGYAVAAPEEAYELRRENISKPILILGFAFDYAYEDMIRLDIRPAIFTDEMAERLARAAGRIGRRAKLHIKVDTGMGRIGIQPDDEGISFVKRLAAYPELEIEGIFTHFARADETDDTWADKQLTLFRKFVGRVEREAHITIPYKHCLNSAGIIKFPNEGMDMARAGIIMYGLNPSDEVRCDMLGLRPIMSLRSHISFIKRVDAGTRISYGGTYEAHETRVIATVPIGYGDGYPRLLSNRGEVIIRGRRAPIRGRICMDQFMVDVTYIQGVSEGDMVTLIGRDGDEEITMEELGSISGRFNYELACDIGRRIPRVYTRHGEVEEIMRMSPTYEQFERSKHS